MNDDIEALKAKAMDALGGMIKGVTAKAIAEWQKDPGPGPDPEPNPDPDLTPDPGQEDDIAYVVMKHHGQPDLGQFGLDAVKMYYESAVTSGGNPDKSKLQAAARASKGLVILDIESWADAKNKKKRGYWRVDQEGREKYIQALRWYREAMPAGHKVALYSIMPVRNLWDAIADRDSQRFKKWQGWNDEVAPIAEHVDLLFPSCYTFTPDRDQWVTYCRAQIDEAYRISGGDKKVHPVVWPRYHPGNEGAIDGDFWRIQLQTSSDHADGFLLWDDRREDRTNFDELRNWWDATVDFVETMP